MILFETALQSISHYQRTLLDNYRQTVGKKIYIAPKHMKSLALTQRSEGGELLWAQIKHISSHDQSLGK